MNISPNKDALDNSLRPVLNIRELDVNSFKHKDPLSSEAKKEGQKKILLSGRPKSGKSFLIKHLLYEFRNIYPAAVVFSGSEEASGDFANFIPSTFIHGELDKKDMTPMTNVMKRQLFARKHLQNPWLIVVLDDCFGSPDFLQTKEMRNFFKNGRHYCNFSITASQHLGDVKSDIKSCVDGIFIFKDPNLNSKRRLWENFGGVVPTFGEFNDILEKLTQDHGCMYIDCQSLSSKIEECIFWYKAKAVPSDWKFGCEAYWQHAESRKAAPLQYF